MVEIGRLVQLQIQRSSLKTGDKPNRVYDPAPLLSVDEIWVSPDGILGRGPEGSWVVDVHHRSHPQTKNEDGLHGISVGFTGHYDEMRERFGGRIAPGCAGENIIAENTGRIPLEQIAGGLAVLGPDGTEKLRLDVLNVAHPCRPFTGWALGRRVEPKDLKRHLQVLDDGTRGYRCQTATSGVVCVGDRLAIV
ncbi:MAG TPA: hypothetical protein VI589_14410 [Vicinamibacteria bacterium]